MVYFCDGNVSQLPLTPETNHTDAWGDLSLTAATGASVAVWTCELILGANKSRDSMGNLCSFNKSIYLNQQVCAVENQLFLGLGL